MSKSNNEWASHFFLNANGDNIIKQLAKQKTRIQFLERKEYNIPLEQKLSKCYHIFEEIEKGHMSSTRVLYLCEKGRSIIKREKNDGIQQVDVNN